MAEDDEWEEVTDEAFFAWERSRLAAERDQEEAIAEAIAEELAAAERDRLAAEHEQDRRYQAGMTKLPRAVRHHEESSEVAKAPEEISQVRNEIELATRAVMTAVSADVSELREEIRRLDSDLNKRATANFVSQQMIEVREEIGRRASKQEASALSQELRQKTAAVEKDAQHRATALDEKAQRRTADLKDEVVRLRKQVDTLKRKVSDLSRQRPPSSGEDAEDDRAAAERRARRLSAAIESTTRDDRYSHNIRGYGALRDWLDETR